MRTGQASWGKALSLGLIAGGTVVFVSLVGMVEALGVRVIVVGVIDFGRLLLLLIGFVAGYQVARRDGGAGAPVVLLRGLVTGAVTGVGLAALLLLGSVVNLRGMFINASPVLFEIISFGRGTAAAPVVVAAGALAGLLGAAATFLPSAVRGPLGAGLTAAITVGLFQELLQIILQEGSVRNALREFIFVPEGLPPRGALGIFLSVSAVSVVWRWRRPAVQGWVAGRPPQARRVLRWLLLGLAVALALVMPLAGGLFISQVLVLVGLYTLMGLGLNLEVGFAGLLDLGFVAFFAIGAYTVALLTSTSQYGIAHWSFWAAVPVALVVSLIAGLLFGLPILRIRGDYLAIATLGFGEIIRLLVLSDALRPWLGGSQGVVSIPKPMIGAFEFSGPTQIYYITLVASALIAFVGARLRDSRLGRAWMAMREDEDVAEAMGINLVNVKLLAYGIGGAFAGMGGAIFAVLLGSIFPHSFSLLISINVLALIIVGGMASLPGVVVGSLFLVGLPELLREFSDFRFLVYGAALIIMMQVKPEGLWPAAAVRRELHKDEPVGVVAGQSVAAERTEG